MKEDDSTRDAPGGRDPADSDWFREWFGEEYLELYPHRDREEAARAVELFVSRTDLAEGDRVLDLACGAGRHLERLRDARVDATGLDLSLPLLRRAHADDGDLRLVRADMRRLPFEAESFAAVSSFFTSFGYFPSRDDDHRVAAEITRVLRPGGRLFLDFLNADAVVRDLVPRDESVVEGRRVIQERRLVDDGRVVEKRIRIEADSDNEPRREFVERVRLYTPEELERLLAAEGLEPMERIGDYSGAPFAHDAPRAIVLATAPDSRGTA